MTASGLIRGSTQRGRNLVEKAKPFSISKREVWEAYKRVKANQGAAGVDGQSIAEFESDLSNNLYKLWNRLASGSYFPPPVRTGRYTKGRWPDEATRDANGGRPDSPDGGEAVSRPRGGYAFSPRFVWVPTGEIGPRCSRSGTRAMLALGLGARSRHQRLL